MKRIVSIALLVILVMTMFVACGKGSPAGVYVLKSANGQPIKEFYRQMAIGLSDEEFEAELKELLEKAGLNSLEELITLELIADGQAKLKFNAPGEEEQVTDTWKQEEDKILITADDITSEGILNGKELTLDIDGRSMVFVKK